MYSSLYHRAHTTHNTTMKIYERQYERPYIDISYLTSTVTVVTCYLKVHYMVNNFIYYLK